MSLIETKRCKYCDKIKNVKLFCHFTRKDRNNKHYVTPRCLECSAKRVRAYYIKQADKIRTRRLNLRKQVIELLGGCCAHCGFTDTRALHVDHVHGGGKKDRKSFVSVTAYLKYVIDVNGTGYQCLCANCNCIKQIVNIEYRKHSKYKYS